MNPAVRQLLMGRNRRLSLNGYGPTNPLYVAHRGGSYLGPEETPQAYQVSLDGGIVANEQDVHLTSDGIACLIHDTTVDRTTTGTGAVNTFTASAFQALNIDAGTVMGGGFSDTLNPSLFADVLAAYKGKMLFVPEAKVSGTPSVVVAMLQQYGIPRDQALVQGFTTTAPALAVANGYQGLYLTTNTTTEIDSVKAAGIQWCGLDNSSTSDASFQAWLAAGFKVTAYTMNRRYRRDELLALGLSGFFSDDPIYLAQQNPPATRDNFATQKWQPGMLPGSGNYLLDEQARGRFAAPDYWGWAAGDTATRFVLQGWACPILNQQRPNFTMDFSVKFGATADATRWASVFLADSTFADRAFLNNGSDGSNGYHFLMRKSGSIEIYRKDNGVDVGLGNVASTAIADGEEVSYRIAVTSSSVALYRLDGPSGSVTHSNVKNDATWRGGYFHLGHASVGALFRRFSIS